MGIILLILAAVAGAAAGSFGGVIASRGLRDSLGGRSRCDHCGRTLAWYELLPLASYVALRGRCRTCGAQIGRGLLAWEASGAAVALGVTALIVLTLRLPLMLP